MALPKGALLLLLVAAVTAVPIPETGDRNCAVRCPYGNRFGYQDGKTYTYQFNSNVKTLMNGASVEHSSLRMAATANIEVHSRCEYVLKLSDVSLEDASDGNVQQFDASAEFAQQLTQNALRFAFADGVVTNVCPEESESDWTVNIKRAVLATLQNSMDHMDSDIRIRENTLSGECDVDYRVEGDKIVKEIQTHTCGGHHQIRSAIQAVPYKSESHIKVPSIFNVSHVCEQTMGSDKLFSRVTCREVHHLHAFSNGENGARTEINVTMEKTGESEGDFSAMHMVTRREGFEFKHHYSNEESISNTNEASSILQDMCTMTETDVRPAVPGLFLKLVNILKKLDHESLVSIMNGADAYCTKARNFFIDAIPNIKTVGSMHLIKDLVASGSVDGKMADLWVTSLAFLEDAPSEDMLPIARDILNIETTKHKSHLSIASMVHAYCKVHPNCETQDNIVEILGIFNENLRYNCRAQDEKRRNEVMLALKSIGNMGIAQPFIPALTRCAANEENPMAIRVAAIDAFRRFACKTDGLMGFELMDLLDNADVDAELRIHSYLGIMQCPKVHYIERIRDMMEREEVNQVGSFIWTHLTNLLESKAPYKKYEKEIRRIIEDTTLVNRFDMDKRKFSRNIEHSYHNRKFDVGAQVESNLIWSPKSFVPRSANLNLTTNWFGNSINLMEIGGRVEGLENIMEHLFKGKDLDEAVENFDFTDNKLERTMDQARAQMFMRIFGHEVRFSDFQLSEFLNMDDHFDYIEFIMNLAKEHTVSWTRNMVLVSDHVMYATAAGMPLKLGLNGAATVHVDVHGHMDVRSFFTAPRNLDIVGGIKPSAAVEFVSEMGVDAFVASTGLKMVTTVHSSQGANFNIQLRSSNDMSFEMTLDDAHKMDIVHVKSELKLTKKQQDSVLEPFPGDKYSWEHCTGQTVYNITGMEMCTNLSYPRVFHQETSPWYPFTGTSEFAITMEKKDTHTGYLFEASYIPTLDGQHDVHLLFNTPGSDVTRLMSLDYKLELSNKRTSLIMVSPWKKMAWDAYYEETDAMKHFNTKAIVDDAHTYSMDINMGIVQNRLNVEYTPTLRLIAPGMEEKSISGAVIYRQGRHYSVDLSFDNIFSVQTGVTGDIQTINDEERDRYEMTLAVSSSHVSGSISSFVESNAGVYTTRTEIKHMYGGPEQTHSFSAKIHKNGPGIDYNMNGALTSTIWSEYDSDFSAVARIAEPYFDGDCHFSLEGGKTDDENARFELSYILVKNQGDIIRQQDLVFAQPEYRYTQHEKVHVVGHNYHYKYLVQINGEDYNSITAILEPENRNTFTADANFFGLEAIHLAGHLVPNLNDFSTSLDATYGEQTVTNKLSWSLLTNGVNHMDHAFNLNMNYAPYFTMSVEQTATRRDATIEASNIILWEVTEPFKVNTTAKVVMNDFTQTPTFNFRMHWTGDQFVALEGSHKDTSEGWWSTTRDMETVLIFSSQLSSFPSAASVGLNYTHQQTPENVNTDADLWWAKDKHLVLGITSTGGMEGGSATWDIKTPSTWDIQHIIYTHSYTVADNALSYTGSVTLDEDVINFNLNGNLDIQAYAFTGTVGITTPYDNINTINGEFGFNIGGDEKNIYLRSSWDNDGAFNVELTGHANSNGYYLSNAMDIMVSGSVVNRHIHWSHHNEQRAFNTELFVKEGITDHFNFKIRGDNTNEDNRDTYDGEFALLIPYFNFGIDINFNHAHADPIYFFISTTINIKTTGTAVGENQYNIQHAFEREASQGTFSHTLIFTGTHIYPPIDIHTTGSFTEETFDARTEIKTPEDSEENIVIETSITQTWPIFNGAIHITGPYNPERISIIASNAYSDAGVWQADASVEYGTNMRYEIQGTLGMNDVKEASFTLKTPHTDYLEKLSVNGRFEGSWRRFTFDAGFICTPWVSQWKLNANVNTEVPTDVRVEGSVTKSDEQVFNVVMTHALSEDAYYLTNMDLTVGIFSLSGQHKGLFSIEEKRLYSKSVLVWNQGPEHTLEINVNVGERIDISVELVYPSYDTTFTFSHAGDMITFKTLMAIMANGNEIGGFKVDFSNADAMTIETRIHGFSKLTQIFNVDTTQADPLDFTATYTGVTSRSGDGSTTVSDFVTRLEIPYETITTNTHLETTVTSRSLTQLSFTDTYTFGEQTFTHSGSMDRTKRNINAEYHLTTPWSEVENLDITLAHQGRWTAMEQQWTANHNGQDYTANFDFTKTGRAIRTHANLNIAGAEYTGSLTHKGFDPKDWSNTAEFNMAGTRYAANSQFRQQGKQLDVSLNVNIPEEYGFSFSHAGPKLNFANEGEIIVQGKHYNASTEFRYRDNGETVTARAGYSVPLDNIDYLILFSKVGNNNNMEFHGELLWDGDHYTTDAEYTSTGGAYTGSFTTTYPTSQTTGGFSMTGFPTNIQLTSNLNVEGQEYHYTATYRNNDVSEVTGNLHLPYEGYENFGFTARYETQDGHAFTASVATPFPDFQTQEIGLKLKHTDTGVLIVGNIDTNHTFVQNIGFELHHEGNSYTNFMTSGKMVHPEHSAKFDVHCTLTEDMRTFTAGAMGEYNQQRFEGNLEHTVANPSTGQTDRTLKINIITPYDMLRSANIAIVNHMTVSGAQSSGQGTFNVHHNSAHIAEVEFSGSMGGADNGLHLDIKKPIPAVFDLTIQTEQTSERATGVLTYGGEQYTMEFTMTMPAADTNRLHVVYTAPSGDQSEMTVTLKHTDVEFSNQVEMVWGPEATQRYSHDIVITMTVKSSRIIYDGRANWDVMGTIYEGTLDHKYNPGRVVNTEITFIGYSFAHELRFNDQQDILKDFDNTLTITTPGQTEPLTITVHGGIDLVIQRIEGNIVVAIADRRAEFNGEIANKSPSPDNILFVADSWLKVGPSDAPTYHFINLNHLYNNASKMGIFMSVSDQTPAAPEPCICFTKLEYAKQEPSLVFELDNLKYDIFLTTTHHYDEDKNHHIDLHGHLDNTPFHGSFSWMPKDGIDGRLYYDNNMGRIHVEMVSPSVASFEVYHEINNVKTEDVVLTVRMNTTRLVHGRAHMRNDIFQSYESIIPADETIAQMTAALNEPSRIALVHFTAAAEHLAPAGAVFIGLHQTMMNNWQTTIQAATQAYENNKFYVKEMVEWFMASSQGLIDWINSITSQAQAHINSLAQYMPVSGPMELAPASWTFSSFSEEFSEAMDSLTNTISEGFQTVSEHPQAQIIMDAWHKLQNLDVDTSFLDGIEIPEMPTQSFEETYNEVLVDLNDMWNDMKERPEFSAAQEYMDVVQENVNWALEYYGVNEKVASMNSRVQNIQREPKNSIQAFVAKVQRKVLDYLQLNRTRVTVWMPENWEVQAEVYLPFEMRDLESVRKYAKEVRGYIRHAVKRIRGEGEKARSSMWTTFYTMKPHMKIEEYIPPFSSHATIAGHQQFLTFDRKFYEYAGSCSYVLAKDTITNLFQIIDFKVVVNYDRSRNEKSITVEVDGSIIKVSPEFKVHIDGRRSEFPVMVGDTSVSRVGDMVRVDSDHGFSTICDLPHDRCTVEVSGWYFGRTEGLMGTYDNEPYTDFMTYDNPEDLANAMTDGNKCQVINHAEISQPDSDDEDTLLQPGSAYYYCHKHFLEVDHCFGQLDNDKFMQMCIHELTRKQFEEQDICDMFAFYSDECHRATGTIISPPSICQRCEFPNGTPMIGGDSSTLQETVPQSADVVFVVAMNECNTAIVSKLGKIVKRLESGLQTRGINDNKFGLVGYGGEGFFKQPHSHTTDGMLMGPRDRFANAISEFPIASGDHMEDSLAAIKFAAKYNFRTGVSKTIIVVPCERCEEHTVNYSEVQELLNDRDITLNTLLQHEFSNKDDPVGSNIFGIDRRTVYSLKDFGEVDPVGDEALRSEVAIPKDYCTALTDHTEGTLFNSFHLTSERTDSQKKFLDVMSAVVAMKAEPAECQTCTCMPNAGIGGTDITYCIPCDQGSFFYSIFPDLIDNFDNFEAGQEYHV